MTTNKILTPLPEGDYPDTDVRGEATENIPNRSEEALEKRRAYQRKYYRKHKAKARKYARDNSEKLAARSAQWRKDNRARYLAQQAMYDLNKRGRMFPEDRIRRAYNWIYGTRSDPDEG